MVVFLPLLVALLRSDQPAVQEQAARALWALACGDQENKDVIMAACVVPQLVALLDSNHPAVQETAGAL